MNFQILQSAEDEMKRTISGIGFVVAMCLLFIVVGGCGGKSGGALKKEYRMQVTVGPTTYWGMGAAKFAELVKQKTSGRIVVKPYFGSQLLKGAQLNSAQMVAEGAIDCAFESTINTAPMIPEMNLFTLPFFVNNYENLDKIEKGAAGGMIFRKMLKKNLMPLAWGENGFRQLTNSKKAVGSPDDLKHLKVRVVGSPIFIDIFRALGADPVNMNWGDAVTAFQQKTVDGQENPVAILLAVQIWQYHKYACFWNYAVDPLVIYWNKDEWDAFPDDIKKQIKQAAIEAGEFEKALCRAGLDGDTSINLLKKKFHYDIPEKKPLELLKEKGMRITRPGKSEIEAFKKKVKPVMDKWIPIIGEDVYGAALKDMLGNTGSPRR